MVPYKQTILLTSTLGSCSNAEEGSCDGNKPGTSACMATSQRTRWVLLLPEPVSLNQTPAKVVVTQQQVHSTDSCLEFQHNSKDIVQSHVFHSNKVVVLGQVASMLLQCTTAWHI